MHITNITELCMQFFLAVYAIISNSPKAHNALQKIHTQIQIEFSHQHFHDRDLTLCMPSSI